MKGLYLYIACVSFSNLSAQSLEHFGLKGNVKTLQEELKICSNLYGKTQTKDCSSLTSEKQFTKDGYLVDYKDSWGFVSTTREKVETPTGWLETVFKEDNGVKRKWSENYYDKQNVINKTIDFDKLENVSRITNYFYNEAGRIIKMERVSHFNTIEEKAISYFDEYGMFNAAEMYENDKLISREEFVLEYKFDEKGNWVQSTVISQFSTDIHNRKITYY